MAKFSKDLIILALSLALITFLVWLPHILALPNFLGLNFGNGFNTIYRNFDGLEYIIISKSWYNPQVIAHLPQSLSASYYAAHFPGYALVMMLLALLIGYLKSMLVVSLVFTLTACWAFYFLVRDFKLSSHPLFLSFVFLILPARWVIVHSVGSSEPMFIAFVILSLYFFMKYEQEPFKHLKLKEAPDKSIQPLILSGLFGLAAQITRPPGILLFIALGLYVTFKLLREVDLLGYQKAFGNFVRYYPLLIIPIGLLGIFAVFANQYHDFFAYFHSGDNIHLTFPPFQVFNKGQYWVGDIWLEDIIYIFILGFLGAVTLVKRKLLPLAFFVFTYLTASTLVAHRDVSRYVLPIFPFVLIAFEKVLVSKEFKIVLAIVGLGIYLYAQNFIIQNVAPIPNPQLFN